MSSDSLQHKTLRGTIWASVDRFSTIGVQFAVNLVLARLLFPADFGAIGMLTIFTGVTQVIIDGGFISALIQRKNPTQTDYSTIFYWNVFVALLLYGALFLAAPTVARFYHMPILCPVLRVYGLWVIVFSINVVQTARLRKQLAFRSIAIANVSAIVASGALGILMAHNGMGVWSLVWQQISYGLTITIIYIFITRWRPSLEFSLESLRSLFSFGGYMFVASVLQEICRNFQGIIIGRRFSATDMGYYAQADRLDRVTSQAFPMVISQVMYPVYSSIQDDHQRLSAMLADHVRVISFLIFPLMGCLILAADAIISILFGSRWLPCAAYFQILCVGGFFACLQNVNYFAVAAVGRSRQLFLWSFYKWGFMLGAMLVGMFFGIFGVMWSIALSSFNIFLVNAWLVWRHIGLPLRRQFFIIAIPLVQTAAAIAAGYLLIALLGIHPIAAAAVALILYIALNWMLHTRSFGLTIRLLRSLRNR